jgi:hypothetical protein
MLIIVKREKKTIFQSEKYLETTGVDNCMC